MCACWSFDPTQCSSFRHGLEGWDATAGPCECACHDDYDTEDWDQDGFEFAHRPEAVSILLAPETLSKLNTLRTKWGCSLQDAIGRLLDEESDARARN